MHYFGKKLLHFLTLNAESFSAAEIEITYGFTLGETGRNCLK